MVSSPLHLPIPQSRFTDKVSQVEKSDKVNMPSPLKSWSSLVASPAAQSNLNLPFFPPAFDQGSVTIHPPPEILKKGASIWNSSLIGFFLHSKLPFKVVEVAAQRLWGNYGLQKVFLHSKGYFIFKFKNSADRDNVLALGPWYISNRHIILQHWKEGIDITKELCTKAPIWVKLHHIPLSYWTVEGLGYLASGIGKPLFTDKATGLLEPMNYARICVEISVESSLPNSLSVAIQDDQEQIHFVEVAVEYQNKPSSCPSCKTFGHSQYKCPNANYQWIPKENSSNASSATGKNLSVSPSLAPSLDSGKVSPLALNASDINDETWTDVPRKSKSSVKGLSDIPPPSSLGNPFTPLTSLEVDFSDTDNTPVTNPLVSKLKLIDEKEGKDMKNKGRGCPPTANSSKKRNNPSSLGVLPSQAKGNPPS